MTWYTSLLGKMCSIALKCDKTRNNKSKCSKCFKRLYTFRFSICICLAAWYQYYITVRDHRPNFERSVSCQ